MGSDVTPNRSRRGWRLAPAWLTVAANAFHSSGVFGGVFQLSGIGVERSCCISGLTVFGIGSVRAGICRGAGVVWTLPSVAANRYGTRVQRTASRAQSAK